MQCPQRLQCPHHFSNRYRAESPGLYDGVFNDDMGDPTKWEASDPLPRQEAKTSKSGKAAPHSLTEAEQTHLKVAMKTNAEKFYSRMAFSHEWIDGKSQEGLTRQRSLLQQVSCKCFFLPLKCKNSASLGTCVLGVEGHIC